MTDTDTDDHRGPTAAPRPATPATPAAPPPWADPAVIAQRRRTWWRWGALRVIGGLAFAALASGLVMLLWNAVVPGLVPGVQHLDWLHAAGLLLLSRILVGGFHRGHHRGHHAWRHEIAGRSAALSEQERAEMRQRLRGWHRLHEWHEAHHGRDPW